MKPAPTTGRKRQSEWYVGQFLTPEKFHILAKKDLTPPAACGLLPPSPRKSRHLTNKHRKNRTMKSKIAKAAALIAQDVDCKKYLKANEYASPEQIAEDLARFVSATREGRMFAIIHSVSSSGMSRVLSFHSMEKLPHAMNDGRKFSPCNFYMLFSALGYTRAGDGFRIHGCGMDMVFSTHYNLIHDAARFGLITKVECDKLAQMTPARY